ncbi:MAG: FTR1 family protein [Rhodobacterales bacterium]
MSGQIIFIVWRESVEALLVVGILNAWLHQNAPGSGAARYLWGGVVAGMGLALGIAYALFTLSEILPPDSLDYFMVAMMFVAMVLIVQMVLWMRSHGRQIKHHLEQGLGLAVEQKRWWGIFVLALIAVAREGSETVVFVYGLLSSSRVGDMFELTSAVAVGIMIAVATYGVLQLGGRYLSWRLFFKVTEIMLLSLACALAVTSADKLISLGILPYTQTIWDTGWLLDDGTRFGGVVSAMTGYRSAPDQIILAVWALYWGMIFGVLKLQRSGWALRRKDRLTNAGKLG